MKFDKESLTSFIGEGVHTGLRKCCDSPEAVKAWNAIHELKDEEWADVCEFVAEALLEAMAGEE